ncbi:MAG: serine hydrolase domain-containing protein [Pseudomonadota bacterium]
MRQKILPALITVMFLAGCGSGSEGPGFTQEDLQATLTSEWQAFSRDKTSFGGGLAMQIISPKGEYFISTGMGPNITNSWHFRTASCTKTFTAAAIMLLHQRERLNIDDLITANIPGTNIPYVPTTADFNVPYKKQITIRMLLMHRAGVFDVTNKALPVTVPAPYGGEVYPEYILGLDPNHQFTLDELVGVDAAYQISDFIPGSSYNYSNTGYSILGKIIERVSGQAYADFVKDEMMVPNSMLNSSLPVDALDQGLPSPYVDGYVWDGAALVNVTISNMSVNVAEGNVITTPKDLAMWCYKLLRGEAGLNYTTVEMMKSGMPSTGDSKYGLGISYTPKLGYGHSGAHAGYLTHMFYHPETNVSYVLLSNVWDFSSGMTSLTNQLTIMGNAAGKVLAQMGY